MPRLTNITFPATPGDGLSFLIEQCTQRAHVCAGDGLKRETATWLNLAEDARRVRDARVTQISQHQLQRVPDMLHRSSRVGGGR